MILLDGTDSESYRGGLAANPDGIEVVSA